MQKEFIQNEIWILVFGGAFQRASLYKKNVSEKERKDFRIKLRAYIENTFLPQYKNVVNEEIHIENITNLSEFTTAFNKILTNGIMNFGVSQKLLNLYLKYQWCLGLIEKPPHFPVDRIIQQKLNFKPIISWTQIKKVDDYMKIINCGKDLANKQNISLAQLELELFNRRVF